MRCNGEETVSVIDRSGNIFPASIPSPPSVTVTSSRVGGTMVDGYYGYVAVYVASSRYPLIANSNIINGRQSPRSLPSSGAVVNTNGSGNANKSTVSVTVTRTSRSDIDLIWIFRTLSYPTSASATNAVAAGLLFFLKETPNTGAGTSVILDDGSIVLGNDQVDVSCYPAPQMQYCI